MTDPPRITCTILAPIVPKGRPRFVVRGKFATVYTPAATRKYEKLVASEVEKVATAYGWTYTDSDRFSVTMDIYRQRSNIDLDNTVKSVFDALNGVTWVDDRHVVELFAYVTDHDKKNPRVELTIEKLSNVASSVSRKTARRRPTPRSP